jgi:U32 family peptidase
MNKNKKYRIPELLAPAGSLAAGLTAFDSGADAVYAGLAKFNARERTENFTLEEMSKLIAYAHDNDKKVYLAFNTLIKESELPEAAENIYQIAKLRPDAVIVQDLGILRLIREYFPSLTIHASTQMGIHNSAGVNFVAKMGVKRVILERQVNLAELKKINENSRIETEVFVHGALCCSMSGNCLFSSWQGGWSGNRGKCKQPCRRRYYSTEGNGFFFSTKDLYSLDIIPELKKIGVSSLKIEGRLRKPDYVRSVVTAYRNMLDTEHDDDQKTLKKSRDILSRSLGRKWSGGFKDKDSCREVILHNMLGVSGQPCGKVLSLKNNGFNAFLSNTMHIGDRVRVQPKSGEEGPTFTITKFSQDKKSVLKIHKGSECFIFCDKEIPPHGSIIYKIGESGGDQVSRIANLPLLANLVDLDISVSSKGLYIKVKNLDGFKHWVKELEISDAIKKELSKETIVKEFSSTRSAQLKAGLFDVNIIGKLFLPASILKQVRREFWEWFESEVNFDTFEKDATEGLEKFRIDYTSFKKKEAKNSNIDTYTLLTETGDNPIDNSLTVHTIEEFNPRTKEIILPNYAFEYELNNLSRKIRAAVNKGIKSFRVTSLYGFELLKSYKGISISTSYPFPIVNSFAAKEIKTITIRSKLKLNSVQAWVELEKEEIANFINRTNEPIEIYQFGRPYILITRAFINTKGKITDSKGNNFYLIKDMDHGLVYLYPGKVFKCPEFDNTSKFYDLQNASLDDTETSTFNLDYALL